VGTDSRQPLPSVPVLLQELTDTSKPYKVRRSLLKQLGETGDSKYEPVLLRFVADQVAQARAKDEAPDENLLDSAFKALGLVGREDAKWELVNLLTSRSLYGNNVNSARNALEEIRRRTATNEAMFGNSNAGSAEAEKRIDKALKTGATELDLGYLRLTKLPESLGLIPHLHTLCLAHNDLTQLPDSIGRLTELRRLEASSNKLTVLPEAITQLSNLIELELSDNRLSVLPESIGRMSKLEVLDLGNNALSTLPASLRDLSSLVQLKLQGNESLGVPEAILGQYADTENETWIARKTSAILDYYFRLEAASRPLNEAKLIVVGSGGVGKTTLVKRLLSEHYDEFTEATHGIEVSEWQIRLASQEKVHLHLWDFGGQEVLHATHRFFMTQRSLYLVVLDTSQGPWVEADYWLKLVESYGADDNGEVSPVLVVLNKIKDRHFDLDRQELQRKYPFIRGFVSTDCSDNTGIAELRAAIIRETNELRHLRYRFPAAWFVIKDALSSLRRNYQSFDKYRQICIANGLADVQEQESLASCLHDLGIALNYRDEPRLRDTQVLNPRWMTKGIYAIFHSPQVASQSGKVRLSDAPNILDRAEYPQHMHAFLFELMRKFELCFSFPDNQTEYLIPELLPRDAPPEAAEFQADRCLNFQYRYPVLPPGLLPRFIVRTHSLSEGQPRWRTGVILLQDKNRALVRADMLDQRVLISISGPMSDRRGLLAVIRSHFEEINTAVSKLKPEALVPLPGRPDIVVPYAKLEALRARGIEVLHESVGGELLELSTQSLLESVDLRGEPPQPDLHAKERRSSNDHLADNSEMQARAALANSDYRSAWDAIKTAIQHDQTREGRLQDEFGFLGGALADDSVLTASRLDWFRCVWQVLSERNSFPLPDLQPNEIKREIKADHKEDEKKGTTGPTIRPEEGTAEQKGDQLEKAMARLFRTFFQLGDDVPWKIRQQKRGTQGGYDLSIEWSGKCEAAEDTKVRCHIECKNYKGRVSLGEVAEKLLAEPRRNPVIDHWILISPRSDPANPLNDFLEKQKEEGTFPFEVQVWSPETGINELFGLEPDVYDLFPPAVEDSIHPRLWDDAKREAVRAKWRKKLEPPLRLPPGWAEYLRNPDHLCIHQEKASEMALTFANYVRMPCRNAAGALLEKPLEEYVDAWLAEPNSQVLFLLGEFGDGKSFFTYALARRLTANWKADRAHGILPLRLALRSFPGKARDFLRDRVEIFGADVGGWTEMGKLSRRLVILDGFDEMSVEIDPVSVTKNIKALLACLDEFKDCKVLVTSRTHFFQNRNDAQRLLERANGASIYHLAPIRRDQVISNVAASIPGNPGQELLRRLQTLNDPIGLATKPLFLEMLKQILGAKDLPSDLEILTLYERYIDLSLQRKQELLDDPNLSSSPKDTIKNLRGLLGEIAEELQRSGKDYVLLKRLLARSERPFAQLLWKLSGPDEWSEDARTRVGARSLLGRVLREDVQDDWPVDFCHRSMREYFVATRLCEAVESGAEAGAKFLQEIPLNHEILEFAAERWRKSECRSVQDHLLALIKGAVSATNPGGLGGYALTLLYRIAPRLPREFDWKGKIFDGADLENADLSGLDFRGSSFRNANFANVNFENATFEECDFTGVRIEQTAPVLCIGRDLSGEKLLAAYRDGVLRQWHLKPGGKTPSNVLGTLSLEAGCAVGIHESGQRWLRSGSELTFFASEEDERWRRSGCLRIKDSLDAVRAQGRLLVFTDRNQEGGDVVTVVDLQRQGKLCSIGTNGSRHCAALGTAGVVWSDAKVGFRVRPLARHEQAKEIILACEEPSCLDVYRLNDRAYLLGSGTGDGLVHVWKVTIEEGNATQSKLLEFPAHKGAVTTVAFIDETRISSGGADCAIVVSRWTRDEMSVGIVERKLQLKMRCRGLKIDGLKTEAEYIILSELVREAENPVSA